VLAEFCELTPFGTPLFSTDAYMLPELYLVGAGLRLDGAPVLRRRERHAAA